MKCRIDKVWNSERIDNFLLARLTVTAIFMWQLLFYRLIIFSYHAGAIMEEGKMPLTHYRNPERGRGDISLQFDEDGFLINTDAWTAETAEMIAQMDGLGNLEPDHWAVINYLREIQMKSGGLPVMSRVCRTLRLGNHGVHRLFGNCREAWRIAGLPNPGEEAKAYMT